jgi:hypothetical protein
VSKIQVVQQLVDILLDLHPQSRATAAGDTHARFVHIPDTESRRATLGRLAFGIRSEGADAGFPIDQARKLIREYLTDGESYGYTRERAISAASEILAVNAETIGLLVERAPGEIGFAHAMFEDFLSAVHIQSWPFPDIVTLVREKSGDARWKNVISNIVSLSVRRTEADDLIAALEAVARESLNIDGDANRDILLAEIAFNSSKKSPATASRLVDRAFRVIERGTWLPGRREVLRSALMNVSPTPSGSVVDERLHSWAPRRQRFSNNVFLQLETWAPAPDLLEALLRGVFDEERVTQTSAAKAIAAVTPVRFVGHESPVIP